MARINLCLGAKGGIGKSFVAALLAQYLADTRLAGPPICVDMDFKTRTFAKYNGKGLDVKLIDLETDGDIERRKFDVFVHMVAEASPDDVFVVDTGGNIYLALMNFLIVNGVADMLLEMGNELLLHIPVMGGQELDETLDTLSEVIHEMPPAALVAVWINQFNGLVEKNGKTFEQSDIYNQNKSRIRSVSYFPRWRPDMEHDVSEMLKARMTFDWAMGVPTFSIMERQRLKMAKRYLYEAVASSRVCE